MTRSTDPDDLGAPPLRVLRGHLSRAARVDTDYAATLALPDHFETDPDGPVEGLDRIGLAFDPLTATLSGTPREAGTFEVRVHGHWRAQRAVVLVDLPVTPDPFSLWQDLPSDGTARFAKPDTDHGAATGDLTLLMASRRGRKHANTGAFRDDDAGILHDPATGWHIGVAADGAGSAALSREGSRLAVAAVMAHLSAALAGVDDDAADADPRPVLRTVLVAAARAASVAIERSAERHGDSPDDYATTLVVGVVRRCTAGWLCATFSVGDGLAALWDAPGGRVTGMMAADSGEFAGQTRFLRRDLLDDSAACDARLFIARPAEFTALCLMTDGISDARFPTAQSEADPAHWHQIWAGEIAPHLAAPPAKAAAALCDWLNFRVPGEHDDRSLILMLPRGAD